MMNNDSSMVTGDTETARLQAEVALLKQQLGSYTDAIGSKVDSIEADMERLVAENERLISLRMSAEVERDACIALATELAVRAGLAAGAAEGGIAVIDLPSGQVAWEIAPSEAHMLDKLPRYAGEVVEVEIGEKYSRVMNSGLQSSGHA